MTFSVHLSVYRDNSDVYRFVLWFLGVAYVFLYIWDMEKKIISVFLWFLLTYFFISILGGFAQTMDLQKFISTNFGDAHTVFLTIADILVFGLGAISMYLVFFVTYPQKNIYYRTSLIILGLTLTILLRFLLQEVLLFHVFKETNYSGSYTWHYYFFDNLYYVSLFSIIGIIYFFFQYSKYSERMRNKLILEKKKAELSFLRSQVNPHFLFNSLNNLYSLVYHQSENSLSAIEKLSNLLRFSLYDNQDRIHLKKEIKYIDDFLELEQMRHAESLVLKMEIDRSLGHLEIPPYLLIPFVENAIKHGELNNPNNPVFISLEQKGNHLYFKVENKIVGKQKDKVGGVGLNNVKRRLELLHPGKYVLDIKDKGNWFRIFLKLDLS